MDILDLLRDLYFYLYASAVARLLFIVFIILALLIIVITLIIIAKRLKESNVIAFTIGNFLHEKDK